MNMIVISKRSCTLVRAGNSTSVVTVMLSWSLRGFSQIVFAQESSVV